MVKKIGRKLAIVLTMALLLTAFTATLAVSAASTADMKNANVKWDLKNNKTLKYKTQYAALGVKTQKVKMTNYKVTAASQEGYKQCTFTMTFTTSINPSKKQVKKMATAYSKYGSFGDCYFTVVDYVTGKCLEEENDVDVTVTSSWKHSKYKKFKGTNGTWIRIARKSVAKVTIVYPETYKNLAIGAGGMTSYKYDAEPFWAGNKVFSKTKLYSKKDKAYAHFKRVK